MEADQPAVREGKKAMGESLKIRAMRFKQFERIPPGLTIASVAMQLRVSYNIAQKWCRNCGYVIQPGPAFLPDGTPLRDLRKEQIAKLPPGLTVPQAAERLGLSYNITHRWLREFGYELHRGPPRLPDGTPRRTWREKQIAKLPPA